MGKLIPNIANHVERSSLLIIVEAKGRPKLDLCCETGEWSHPAKQQFSPLIG
jgi:hypothetical protein